jgi:UDP-N-acetylglucosamine acyltransferase
VATVDIHPTAIVDREARLDDGVRVGPYAVIGPGVHLGADTWVDAHCVINGVSAIGRRCRIGPHAVLGTPPQLREQQAEQGGLRLGADNRVREFVTIHGGSTGSETVLGRGNLLMASSHVAHDCQLGDQNELANAAQIAGHVVLGSRVTIGGLAGVHQHVRIGDLALVGAGSMVSQDVPPFCCVSGDRARLHGLNRVGLRRARFDAELRERLARAVRALYAAPTIAEGVDALAADGREEPLVAQLASFALSSTRGLCRPLRSRAA